MANKTPLTRDRIKIGLRICNNSSWAVGCIAVVISSEYNDIHYGQVVDIEWQHNKTKDILMIDRAVKTGNWSIASDQCINPILQRIEQPCRICTKMNDTGITICWNCGNHPWRL